MWVDASLKIPTASILLQRVFNWKCSSKYTCTYERARFSGYTYYMLHAEESDAADKSSNKEL